MLLMKKCLEFSHDLREILWREFLLNVNKIDHIAPTEYVCIFLIISI